MDTLTPRDLEILIYSKELQRRYGNARTDEALIKVLEDWSRFMGPDHTRPKITLPSERANLN